VDWIAVVLVVGVTALGTLALWATVASRGSAVEVASSAASSGISVVVTTPTAGHSPEPSVHGETPTHAVPPREASELALVQRVRDALGHNDPDQALTLLDTAAERFPHGVTAEERRFLRASALVAQGSIAPARAVATEYYEEFPEGRWAARLERLTGAHPRPAPGPPRKREQRDPR
jgi:hypothetical protein